MKEADFVRQSLTQLRKKDRVVLKHSDRFTTGIPDISCTARGKTTWLEFKAVDEQPIERVAHPQDQLQLHTMWRLATYGRAIYVICDNDHITVWHPEYLVRRIITDKNYYWTDEMYVKANGQHDLGLIEGLVKNVSKDPIWFPEWDLTVLDILVEV